MSDAKKSPMTEKMTFLEVLPIARVGAAIRQEGWIKGLWIRWSHANLSWEWVHLDTGDHIPFDHAAWETLPASNGCLTPMEMTKTGWTAFLQSF